MRAHQGHSLRSLVPPARTDACATGELDRAAFAADMPERRAAEADALAKRPLRCELVHLLCYCFPMQCHTSSVGRHARSVRARADQGHSLRSLAPPARTNAYATGGLVRPAPTADMPERRAAEADALAKRLLRRELVHLPGHCFARQRHTSSVGWHARSVWARADQGFFPRSSLRPLAPTPLLQVGWTVRHSRQTGQNAAQLRPMLSRNPAALS